MKKRIPNSLTLLNLLMGCISIVLLLNEQYQYIPHLMFIAIAADFLDGFAARLLNVNSELGLQLDSLADMVTFGFLPGAIMYQLLMISFDSAPMIVENNRMLFAIPAFLITICSALRLAKFNIDTRQSDEFIGLATPTNTIFFLSLLMIYIYNPSWSGYWLQEYILYPIVLIFSFFLISEIPMFSFKVKEYSWKNNKFKYSILSVGILSILLFQHIGFTINVFIYLSVSIFRYLMGITSLPQANSSK